MLDDLASAHHFSHTHMDIIIHRSSNHPYDHKLAAFKYYINRMVTLSITEKATKQEWGKNNSNGS